MKIRLTVSLIIMGALLLFLGGKGLIVSMLPAQHIDSYDCDWTKLHANQRVSAELNFVLDPFEETTDKYNKSVSCIYTVPELRDGDDGNIYMTHFMGVVVGSKDYPEYDKLVNDSWDWWDGEYDILGERGVIQFDGYLRKMSAKEKGFLKDYLKDFGYPDEKIEEMIIPYVMMKSQTPVTNILMTVGGLLLFAAGMITGIVSFIKK